MTKYFSMGLGAMETRVVEDACALFQAAVVEARSGAVWFALEHIRHTSEVETVTSLVSGTPAAFKHPGIQLPKPVELCAGDRLQAVGGVSMFLYFMERE